jgi:predicted transcriptional regulator
VGRFGDLEAAIMDVVWAATDRLLVRDVWASLNKERELAYTTVQTVMDILHRKGWLDREKQGRAYAYWATRSREDYAASLLGQALEASSNKTGALVRLFEQLDPGEVSELRTALDQLKAQEGRA